jgi:hypothetical protein
MTNNPRRDRAIFILDLPLTPSSKPLVYRVCLARAPSISSDTMSA